MLPLALVLVLAAVSDVRLEAPRTSRGATRRLLTFKDTQGEHRVAFVLAPVTTRQGDGERVSSRRLVITHEARATAAARWRRVWEAKDFVLDCPFDLTLELLPDSIEVTDADGDGEGEVSFIYRLGCRSDVSPLGMKLLLYEGGTKYALRGQMREQVGIDEQGQPLLEGGAFTPDAAFARAPPVLLELAKAKWEKYLGPAAR